MISLPVLFTLIVRFFTLLSQPLEPLDTSSLKNVRFSEREPPKPQKLKVVCYMPSESAVADGMVSNDQKTIRKSDVVPCEQNYYLNQFVGHPHYEFLKSLKEGLDSWEGMIDDCCERTKKISVSHQRKIIKKLEEPAGKQQISKKQQYKDLDTEAHKSPEDLHIRLLEATSDCPICIDRFQEPKRNNKGQWEWEKLYSCPACNWCFHIECLDRWLSKEKALTCPTCRTLIDNGRRHMAILERVQTPRLHHLEIPLSEELLSDSDELYLPSPEAESQVNKK
ncbi:hypothetical protein PGT21_005747 [Puccinia graminis f. sp. tritici]|uniref:RING-type domain-containing protein n=1 Tax=Puccinia graminis f. sp. tritici TaxID=56615 RepID=A0A5B0RDF6_PUCGR|nr:hypothetical protein PGT21_005747 [Puccinia graminis f. sp. tritici]KAA1123851.1 hypothetical protein PGTUg99_026314 [Puccinia graminis f. sp. tritici]